MFKKSDLEGIIELIKETKKDGDGFKGFVQGFKELGNVSIKSSNIVAFTKKLNDYIGEFNNRGADFNLDTFLEGIDDKNIADKFKAISESADDATASLKDMFAVKIGNNTHGLKNIKSLINDFNNLGTENQKDFAAAIGQTNSQFGNYLSNLDGAKARISGYVGQLVKTTAKTIGLQVATIGLNTLIVALGSAIVSGITKLVNYTDDLSEAAGNAVNKLSSLKEESKSLMNNFNEMSSDFEKLSKGVNNFGENISLTTDEYNRYKEIANQIANDIPNLIKGYDDEGNAILSLKGNVDELKQAYIEAAKEKNGLAISDKDNDDIVKNHRANIGKDGFLSKLARGFTDEMWSASAGHLIDNRHAKETLEFALNSSYEEVMSYIKSRNKSVDLSSSYLFSLGINEKMDEDEFYELKHKLKSELVSVQSVLDESLNNIKSLADTYMKHSDDYYELDTNSATNTNMQNLVSSLINSMTIEDTEEFKDRNDVGAYVSKIISTVKNADYEVKNAYNNLMQLDVDSMDTRQAEDVIDKNINVLADHLKLKSEDLKVILGVDIEVDPTEIDRDKILNEAKQKFLKFSSRPNPQYPDTSEIEKYLEGLSTEDLSYIVTTSNPFENGISGANEMLEYYNTIRNLSSETESISEDTVENIKNSLSLQDSLSSIIKEQEENGKISNNSVLTLIENGYQAALSYDAQSKSYSVLKSKVDELTKARNTELLATLRVQRADLISKHNKEVNAIEELRKRTGRSTDDVIIQQKLEEASVDDVVSAYDAYISMLENSNNATNDFSDTVSKINQDIEKYSENISKLSNTKSIVKSAQEEQEKFGRLSIDTIKSLHEAGLDGAMSYNEMTGETYFLVDAIDELTRAQIENQKVDINKSITETTNKIAEASEKLRDIGNPSDAYTANMVSGLNQNIAQWQSQLDELGIQKMELGSLLFSFETDDESTKQSAEEAVEEYINSVKEAFDKEKSELDHLKAMDVITEDTYYDSLTKLVEKYYSDKEMFLDEYRQYEEEIYDHLKQKQIDSIQEQIDALKSVNEEKQEEIDLEKAKQALENAKRNKTISVYDSERGWINETDRKAIDTAQKEYDDLVLNEKIEVLENMIDAIENSTNTGHSLDESINAVQQVDGMVDLSKYFKNVDSETLNKMQQIRQSVQTGMTVPRALTNRFDKNISPDSYVVNDNKTINLSGVTVETNDPEQFISQMEQIANKSFDNKFMPAMNNLAEDIKRHRTNHSRY